MSSSSSPSSIVSDMTDMIDEVACFEHEQYTNNSTITKDKVPVTPVSADENPQKSFWPTDLLDDDVLDNLMEDEVVGSFLSDRDTFENDCYAYLGSVIGSSDLMRNLMLLYRGHTDFLIVSKATKKTWVSGTIEHDGFLLKFHRPKKIDCRRLTRTYKEVDKILLQEATYRLNEIVSTTI